MLTLLKRHQVQTMLAAGHDQVEVADLAGVSVRSVRRIAAEPAVEHVDDRQERTQRGIGRPSKVAPFRESLDYEPVPGGSPEGTLGVCRQPALPRRTEGSAAASPVTTTP